MIERKMAEDVGIEDVLISSRRYQNTVGRGWLGIDLIISLIDLNVGGRPRKGSAVRDG